MNTIAERLRQARTRAKYASGSDAARAFGWPVSTYLGHENGDRVPSLQTITKYAKAFRANPSFIIYGNEDINSIVEQDSLIKIRGVVGNMGLIYKNDYDFTLGDYVNIEMKLPDDVFALLINTSNLSYRYNIGDLVIIKPIKVFQFEMGNNPIYVKIADGREFFAKIEMNYDGIGLYDLLLDGKNTPEMTGISVLELGSTIAIFPINSQSEYDLAPIAKYVRKK